MENKYKHMLSYKQRVADANKAHYNMVLYFKSWFWLLEYVWMYYDAPLLCIDVNLVGS